MPMEKVSFEFPEPDDVSDDSISTKEDGSVEIKIAGREDPLAEKPVKKEAKKQQDDEDDIDIEVVDDRPAQDRDKRQSRPPEDLTDDELENYSEKVKKRLQRFSKGYHDQRRAAEEAAREREEAIAYARKLQEEVGQLRGNLSKNQEVMLEQAKRNAAAELEQAKAKYKQAYEAGDGDAVVEAQEALTGAKMKVERVNNFKLPALQEPETPVQTQVSAPAPSVDERAVDWQKANTWFGSDDEMTSFALGLHQKLVKQGVNPKSDEYYEKINSRMRQVFPDAFADSDADDEHETVSDEPRRKANVVAPATRSVAPRKITLTRTQVALANKLGVSLADYAKQVAIEMRKQNG